MRNNPNPGEKELKTYEYNYTPPIRRPSFRREEDVMWQPPGEVGDFSATPLEELSPRAAPISSPIPVAPSTMWQSAVSEQDILNLMLTLSPGKQKEVIHRALSTFSKKERDELSEASPRQLFQDTTDFIWKVIISGLVIILVCSFIAIIAAVLAGANAAPLITIFAAVIAFIGGLLAPSPVQATLRSISSGTKTFGDN